MENRVRKIRRERDLPGTLVAQKLNITPQYYYEIERGEKRLSAEMAAKLAQIFGVSIDYLLGRSDNPQGWVFPDVEDEHVEADTSSAKKLSQKEERDIAIDLERLLNDLEVHESLAFYGEELELDEEARELLRLSIEQSMRLAKQMAKKKFSPKGKEK